MKRDAGLVTIWNCGNHWLTQKEMEALLARCIIAQYTLIFGATGSYSQLKACFAVNGSVSLLVMSLEQAAGKRWRLYSWWGPFYYLASSEDYTDERVLPTRNLFSKNEANGWCTQKIYMWLSGSYREGGINVSEPKVSNWFIFYWLQKFWKSEMFV